MAYINIMDIGYETNAQKDGRRVEDARKEAFMLKKKLDEAESKHAVKLVSALDQIKILDDEQKKLKEKHDQVTSLAL